MRYNRIRLPIGIRYHFFLNDESKIFINGAYAVDITSSSIIQFESGKDLDIDTRGTITFGLGYNYKNKYSLELNFSAYREVLSTYTNWSSDFNSIAIIFGYSLF